MNPNALHLTFTLTSEFHGHNTIGLATPAILGVGNIFRLLNPTQRLKWYHDHYLTLTLTLQVQGHHTIELSTPDILGIGNNFRLLKSMERL